MTLIGEIPDLVSHYTPLGTLPFLLRRDGRTNGAGLGSLWATSVRFLNDRQELLAGWGILREASLSPFANTAADGRRGRDIQQLLQSDEAILGLSIYSVSFSGATDELGQWRGYADDGYGASVVVSRRTLDEQFGRSGDTLCGPVLYGKGDQHYFASRLLRAIYDFGLSMDEALVALQLAAVFMKHEGFAAEREYRLVRVSETYRIRESRRRLVPFLDALDQVDPLAVEKVVLGPAWQLGTLEESAFQKHHVTLGVRQALDLYGLDSVLVERSSIPYDPS